MIKKENLNLVYIVFLCSGIELNKNVGRLRFELRTSRLKAGCSTAELATHFVKLSTYGIIPFKGKKNNFLSQVKQ